MLRYGSTTSYGVSSTIKKVLLEIFSGFLIMKFLIKKNYITYLKAFHYSVSKDSKAF